MPGQAEVVIGENTWSVSVASTVAELTSGLSGVASIPTGTGVLFDMGSDRSSITINMADMLFNLDIAFINSAGGVVGILRNIVPGEAAAFDAGVGLGARYFIEVNAGEMVGVSVGDNVSISGEVQPAFWGALIVAVQAIAAMAVVGATGYRVVKEELWKAKEVGRHSIHGPERERLVKQYGSWAVGRAESVCSEDDVVCVEHEAAEFLAKFKAGRWP